MTSLIESRWSTILENQTPPVPKATDLLIAVMCKWNSDEPPYPYQKWVYHQFDSVTFPNSLPDGRPHLPVNWELDDCLSHDSVMGKRRDDSRDTHLVSSNYWKVKRGPTYESNLPWVIVRVRYEDVEALVDVNRKLKLEHKTLKDPLKKMKWYNEHVKLFNTVSKAINLGLSAESPCRIILKDNDIKVVSYDR